MNKALTTIQAPATIVAPFANPTNLGRFSIQFVRSEFIAR